LRISRSRLGHEAVDANDRHIGDLSAIVGNPVLRRWKVDSDTDYYRTRTHVAWGAETIRDMRWQLPDFSILKWEGRPFFLTNLKTTRLLQFPDRRYRTNTDERQYRRGVYMHWQRAFLHPMLANFDAPSREECTGMRLEANTPQQALNLLNDPSLVEAAKGLALAIWEC
jgi:hypothetical protein